jgi:hypothetical protein
MRNLSRARPHFVSATCAPNLLPLLGTCQNCGRLGHLDVEISALVGALKHVIESQDQIAIQIFGDI